MKYVIEILKIILSVLLSGGIGFWIAKYESKVEQSKEKLEIAYNRIYYPIQKIIREQEVKNKGDYTKILTSCGSYIIKYE